MEQFVVYAVDRSTGEDLDPFLVEAADKSAALQKCQRSYLTIRDVQVFHETPGVAKPRLFPWGPPASAQLLQPHDPRREARASEDPSPKPPSRFAPYHKGMKDLGNGLIGLAVLQAVGVVGLFATGAEVSLILVIVILAGVNLVLGILARRIHAWVNYVVAFSACVILAMNLLLLANVRSEARLGVCLGIVVAGALLYSSVNNLDKLRRAKAQRGDQ